MEDCRARQQVLILDCCFSGAFAHGSKGDADLDLERRLGVSGRGQAVLTASRAGEYSFEGQALPGAAVAGSVFTAGLIEGFRTGAADADGDGYVSVDEAYDYAYRYVQASGASQTPQRWLSGGEGAIVLARSPAGIALTPAGLPEDLAASLDSRYARVRIGAVHELGGWLAGDDPARALTAELQLRKIAETDNPAVAAAACAYLASLGQPAALSGSHPHSVQQGVATDGAAAGKVPERDHNGQASSAGLLDDAERIARSITSDEEKVSALGGIAKVIAATDPGRAARLLDDAERIARSVTSDEEKVSALGGIAKVIAATDPGRAARLLDDAERIARSITSVKQKAWALRRVAGTMAAIDPDRAERIAQSITYQNLDGWGLHDIVRMVAATDPDRAERIALSLPDKRQKASALGILAKAITTTDPDRALGIATSISDESERELALASVVPTVAAIDPDHADRIVSMISSEVFKESALCGMAAAVAAADPGRAERIARSITSDILTEAEALSKVATAMSAISPARAAELLAEVEHITQSRRPSSEGPFSFFYDGPLEQIVQEVAVTDPDRAERIAQSIIKDQRKASALRSVARTVAATDPARAERIAQSIIDAEQKVWALLEIETKATRQEPLTPRVKSSSAR